MRSCPTSYGVAAMTVGILTLTGCGSDDASNEASIEERACARAEECGTLEKSVAACVVDGQAFRRDLSAENRSALDRLVNECLEEETCKGFVACLDDGPGCDSECDYCWDAPGTCDEEFNGDKDGCDCGIDCDFVDVDCGS